jgi:hypothetical protein
MLNRLSRRFLPAYSWAGAAVTLTLAAISVAVAQASSSGTPASGLSNWVYAGFTILGLLLGAASSWAAMRLRLDMAIRELNSVSESLDAQAKQISGLQTANATFSAHAQNAELHVPLSQVVTRADCAHHQQELLERFSAEVRLAISELKAELSKRS